MSKDSSESAASLLSPVGEMFAPIPVKNKDFGDARNLDICIVRKEDDSPIIWKRKIKIKTVDYLHPARLRKLDRPRHIL
jgi:hypothetical protein